MQKFFLVVPFFLTHFALIAQSDSLESKINDNDDKIIQNGQKEINDSLNLNKYKIFYLDGRVETADTSLTIFKDYKFNFLREDNFELLSLPNVAHSYNKLGYSFKYKSAFPKLGARGKHFHYFEKDDIGYYNVATPFTEIFAKSTFEQGQILDALVSINLSPQYNFTIAHKGYKSLGKYVSGRSRGNQFRLSSNFNSKNKKLNVKSHFTSQNIFNEENGGLDEDNIYFFEEATEYLVLDNSGNPIETEDGSLETIEYDGYLDRSRLGSQIRAEGSLYSKRFFIDFEKSLIYNDEKEISNLSVGYQFTHEYKKIEYNDPLRAPLFGSTFDGTAVSDQSRYIRNDNSIYIKSNVNKLGRFRLSYSLIDFENNFKDYDLNNDELILRLNNSQSNLNFNWQKDFKLFQLNFDLNKSLNEDYISDYQSIKLSSKPIKNVIFNLGAINSNKSPNLNFILFRSIYEDYNWHNPDLENQKSSTLYSEIGYKELIKISGEYSNIDNYTFFQELSSGITGEIFNSRKISPSQIDSEISYFKVKLFSKFDVGKFSFINTGQYQKKDQSIEFGELFTLNVPEWITRNTIMFSSSVFNNSLFFQTGFTFNYFTKFYADYYNPLVSEFVSQNFKEIGEFPIVDFFFNAKIQQTRVFLKVEHLNTSMTGYDYYSDPFTPYRDLSVRFGLVWNFFQ